MMRPSAKGASRDGARHRYASFARPIRTSWACVALQFGFQFEAAKRSRVAGSRWQFKEGTMEKLASIDNWNSHRWAGITRT